MSNVMGFKTVNPLDGGSFYVNHKHTYNWSLSRKKTTGSDKQCSAKIQQWNLVQEYNMIVRQSKKAFCTGQGISNLTENL